jgi:hypothetical protein
MIIMLQAIAAKAGAKIDQDPNLQALSEKTEPEKLVRQIEAREEE